MLSNEITNVNWIGLCLTGLIGILLLILPRRVAPFPILIAACFLTFGQRINISGINFYMLRIVILVGWIRLVLRGESFSIKLNAIDKAIICWVLSNIIIYILLRQSSGALINRLGFAYNSIGLYLLFRFLIRDFGDLDRAVKFVVVLVVALASIMLIEYITGRNMFSVFGGVHEITQVRYGRLRCQGPFRHPILAGTFGATLMPFAVALFFKGNENRLLAISGFISATIITIISGSSGPIMTYIAAICGLFAWYFRKHMKAIMWGILVAVFALHYFFMKAPVWFLIARISGHVGRGTGYHRSRLIDQAIKHFDEWWLLGTDSTVHWTGRAIRSNPDMADITNQFIRQGVDGGLLTMILFIIVIALCFRSIGRALRIMGNQPLGLSITVWSMGAALFAHVVTFIGVNYFDQIIVFWYLLVAMISTVSSLCPIIEDQTTNATS